MNLLLSMRAYMQKYLDALIDILHYVRAYRPDAENVPFLAEAYMIQAGCQPCVDMFHLSLAASDSVNVFSQHCCRKSGFIETMALDLIYMVRASPGSTSMHTLEHLRLAVDSRYHFKPLDLHIYFAACGFAIIK